MPRDLARYRGMIADLLASESAAAEQPILVEFEIMRELFDPMTDSVAPPSKLIKINLWAYAHSAGLLGPGAMPALPIANVQPEVNKRKREQPLAKDGDSWALSTWSALLVFVYGKPKTAGETIAHLVCLQQSSGAFLQATAADSIELLALHELQILHAVETFSIRSGNASARLAAQRAAEWHVQETQPDHATSQPWGLNAMIRTPAARPLADMMLQAVRLASVDRMDAVTLLLLRDCLYCIDQSIDGDKAEGMSQP